MISEYKVLFKCYFVIFRVIYFPYLFNFFVTNRDTFKGKKEFFFVSGFDFMLGKNLHVNNIA